MRTTDVILKYAAMQGGTFQRKDLLRELADKQTTIKKRAVDLQISRTYRLRHTRSQTTGRVPVGGYKAVNIQKDSINAEENETA